MKEATASKAENHILACVGTVFVLDCYTCRARLGRSSENGTPDNVAATAALRGWTGETTSEGELAFCGACSEDRNQPTDICGND